MQKCSSPSTTPRFIITLLSTFSLFVKKGESRFQLCYMKKYGFGYGVQNCSSSSTTIKYFIYSLSTFSHFVKKENVVSNFVIWQNIALIMGNKIVAYPLKPQDTVCAYFLLSPVPRTKRKSLSTSLYEEIRL